MNTSRVDKCGKIGCSLSKLLALLHLPLSSTSTLTASTAALTSTPFTFTFTLTFSSNFSALTSASMFSLPDFTTTHFVTSGHLTTKRSSSFVPQIFLRGSASLVLVVPLVSALTVSNPLNLRSSGPAVIVWTVAQGDPQTFSIELINDAFRQQFALANNVQSSAMSLSLALPNVPAGDGYILQLVNIGNITDVFAQSADFAISAAQSTTTSSTSSTTSSTPSSTPNTSKTNAVSFSNLISSNTAQTTAPSSFQTAGTVGTGAPVPTAPGIGNTNNQSTASGSRAKVAGIVAGVVGAIIICLVILLRKIPWSSMIRRGHRKKNAEVPGLPVVREVENNVVPLHLPLESGRRSWTDQMGESVHQAGVVSRQHPTETTINRTKHPAPISNNVSENSQSTVEPISSVMQEVDSLRARIAELERQQQETRQNSDPPSAHSRTDDNRSAPPAYSDDGRY